MIATLNGKISHQEKNAIILEVQGVGYLVLVPESFALELQVGAELKIFIQTILKEDGIYLYGFKTHLDREFFKLLLSVSGIGPKAALNLLSHFSVPQLSHAILDTNLPALSKVPGIGKKTAERLCLELREKLKGFDMEEVPTGGEEVVEFLMSLGVLKPQALATLREAQKLAGSDDFEILLSQSLKILENK
jgi:holliday junction DNA helicase RuvA